MTIVYSKPEAGRNCLSFAKCVDEMKKKFRETQESRTNEMLNFFQHLMATFNYEPMGAWTINNPYYQMGHALHL